MADVKTGKIKQPCTTYWLETEYTNIQTYQYINIYIYVVSKKMLKIYDEKAGAGSALLPQLPLGTG